jgi:hypothetical protein
MSHRTLLIEKHDSGVKWLDRASFLSVKEKGGLNFLDLLLRHNALVGGHPGPRKKADENSSTR